MISEQQQREFNESISMFLRSVLAYKKRLQDCEEDRKEEMFYLLAKLSQSQKFCQKGLANFNSGDVENEQD